MSSLNDEQDYTERCTKVVLYTPDPEKIFMRNTNTNSTTTNTSRSNNTISIQNKVKATNLNTSLLHSPVANNHTARVTNNRNSHNTANNQPSSPNNMHFQSQPQQNASLNNRVVNQTTINNQPTGHHSPSINLNGTYDGPTNNGVLPNITANLNYSHNVQSVTPANNQQNSSQNRASQRSELSQLLEFGSGYMPTSTGPPSISPNTMNRDDMRDYPPDCSIRNHIIPGLYQNQFQSTNQVNSSKITDSSLAEQFRFRPSTNNSQGLDQMSSNLEINDPRNSVHDQSYLIPQQNFSINSRQDHQMIQNQNPSCLLTNNIQPDNINNTRQGFISANPNYSSNYYPTPAHMTSNIAPTYPCRLQYRSNILQQQQQQQQGQNIIVRQALRRNLLNGQQNSNSNMHISYVNQQSGLIVDSPQPIQSPQQQVVLNMPTNVPKTYSILPQNPIQLQIRQPQARAPHPIVYSQQNINQISKNVCQPQEKCSSVSNLNSMLSNNQGRQPGTNQNSTQPRALGQAQRTNSGPTNAQQCQPSTHLTPQIHSNNQQSQSTTSGSNEQQSSTKPDAQFCQRCSNTETKEQSCQTEIQAEEVVLKSATVDRSTSPICIIEPVKRKTTAKRPRRELVRPSSSSGTDVELSD